MLQEKGRSGRIEIEFGGVLKRPKEDRVRRVEVSSSRSESRRQQDSRRVELTSSRTWVKVRSFGRRYVAWRVERGEGGIDPKEVWSCERGRGGRLRVIGGEEVKLVGLSVAVNHEVMEGR